LRKPTAQAEQKVSKLLYVALKGDFLVARTESQLTFDNIRDQFAGLGPSSPVSGEGPKIGEDLNNPGVGRDYVCRK